VLINAFRVAVAESGAALPGVRSPWANLSGAGANYAPARPLSPAVVLPHPRFTASRRIPAMVKPLAVMAASLPVDIRKQYVHKTRVNAGGDGASGPHPEREPA
jgi:hypothetical protein